MVDIRKPPVIKPDSLFKHISIEIDPGHGGYERGALGVTGYAEADANLRYALKLAQRLRAAGATVYLTRTIDKRLSLEVDFQDEVPDGGEKRLTSFKPII